MVVLHELPGLTKADLGFAKRLIESGYTALVPLLFGNPGEDRFFYNFFHICGTDQFDCGGRGRTPLPLKWIREFCCTIRETWKEGLGFGVIGMCLTGEFPISLLTVPDMQAAVMCQPTDPFNALTLVGLGPGSKISLSDDDLKAARDQSSIPILGIRYNADLFCPGKRFETFARMFPQRFHRLDLDGFHHSSLGEDFCEAAFDEVRLYLGQQLKGPSAGGKFPHLSRLPADFKGATRCGKMNHDCKS